METINWKRVFKRVPLTVRVWPKGKEFLDELFFKHFDNNPRAHYQFTKTDVINFIVIRQLMLLTEHEKMVEYAQKLALIDVKRKRIKGDDFKYLESGIFATMVSATFPEPALDFVDDLVVQVEIFKAIGAKRVTKNKVMQLLLFETIYSLGSEIESEVGLAAFAQDLISNYSYDDLANHFNH
jgi:hypothetical protein